jgi:cell shape-determining protein MreD
MASMPLQMFNVHNISSFDCLMMKLLNIYIYISPYLLGNVRMNVITIALQDLITNLFYNWILALNFNGYIYLITKLKSIQYGK